MPAYYVVVQYVPDLIADERINVGVLTYGDGQVRSRFLRDWSRVRFFGGGDIGFLHDFAERVREWDEATVQAVAGRWANEIQVTRPRASLQGPVALLECMAKIFLKEPNPTMLQPLQRVPQTELSPIAS